MNKPEPTDTSNEETFATLLGELRAANTEPPLRLVSNCGRVVALPSFVRSGIKARNPDVLPLLPEAVAKISLPVVGRGEFEIDLGRKVGSQSCIEADYAGLDDPAWFVMRHDSVGATRTVATTAPMITSHVSATIDCHTEGEVPRAVLLWAWIGRLVQPEPWDPKLNGEAEELALAFWSRHAVIVGRRECAGTAFESTFREVIRSARAKLKRRGIRGPGQHRVG